MTLNDKDGVSCINKDWKTVTSEHWGEFLGVTVFKWRISPALHLDVRYSIEVSGQVILIHHGGPSGWLQQPNPQVSDGEEVP